MQGGGTPWGMINAKKQLRETESRSADFRNSVLHAIDIALDALNEPNDLSKAKQTLEALRLRIDPHPRG